MRIYCFNQEFISCSTNGNDPAPNKILLTRSIYGWGRRQGKLGTTKSVNNVPHLKPVQSLTSRIHLSQTRQKICFHQRLFRSVQSSSIIFQYYKNKENIMYSFHKLRRVLKVLNIFKLSLKMMNFDFQRICNLDLIVPSCPHLA